MVDLASFLQKKESSYLNQIESLTRQNNVLFDENMKLTEGLGIN